MSVLETLTALDRGLVAHSWPALSPWWRSTLTTFVESGRRQLVSRVGRRGGKSSSLCRFAVAFALAFDVRQIPPGDVGVIAFISVSRDEASQRLRTIKSILDAFKVAWRPVENGVELVGRPIVFKVFAATVAGVSGFTAILVIADEVAKWRDSDSGANPATEVLASVRPTMATQPHARILLSSSPLSNIDAHAEAFELGDTDFQVTAFAESWVSNPTLTQEATRALEPDERIWLREYAAIPQSSVCGAFAVDAVDRAFMSRAVPVTATTGAPIIVIDASSGRSDSWTWARCRWLVGPSTQWKMEKRYSHYLGWHWDYVLDANEKRIPLEPEEHFPPTLKFDHVSGVEGTFWKQLSAEDIVARIAKEACDAGAIRVVGDQREAYALTALFARHRIPFTSIPWTSASKPTAVEGVRRWMRDGRLWLPEHEKLRQELLQFEEKITPSGQLTYGARGNRHDDFVALLLTAAMADQNGLISMSPHTPRVHRSLPANFIP